MYVYVWCVCVCVVYVVYVCACGAPWCVVCVTQAMMEVVMMSEELEGNSPHIYNSSPRQVGFFEFLDRPMRVHAARPRSAAARQRASASE